MNLDKLLGYDFFIIKKQSPLKKIYLILRIFFKLIFYQYRIKNESTETEFLFFKTVNRQDYNELFKKIYDQCNFDKEILDWVKVKKINIKSLYLFFKHLNTLFSLFSKYGFLNSFYLYLKIIDYIEFLSKIKNIKYKFLIMFSDILPLANIFVQYSNFYNKKTVTMQHGLYVDYEKMPNINMINYLNAQSKYLLAWGNSTKELFDKYNSSIKVAICGKPIYFKNNNKYRDSNLIGVVCDQPMFRKYNHLMIDIAYKVARNNKMKVAIRLHPQDNHEYYKFDEELTEFNKTTDQANILIAHTTSMIYEYLIKGYRVFKLESKIPSNKLDKKLIFNNSKDLEKKINLEFDFISEGRNHISFIGKESEKKYKEFFDNLYEGKI